MKTIDDVLYYKNIYLHIEEWRKRNKAIEGARITKSWIYRNLNYTNKDILDEMCGSLWIDNNIYSFNTKKLIDIENSFYRIAKNHPKLLWYTSINK